MPKAIVALRVVRPYDSEDQFLRDEAFALTRTSLVLVGASPRPEGVILRFEVVLRTGAILLRGEGRVVGHGPTASGEPGLTLKFTRLDPRSKALVDRAGMSKVVEAAPPSEPSLASAKPTSAPISSKQTAPPPVAIDEPMPNLPPVPNHGPTAGHPTVPTMKAVRFPPEAPTSAGEPSPSRPGEPGSGEPASSHDTRDTREAALERLRSRLRGKDVPELLSSLGTSKG
jgi:hypothetical protein